MTMPIIPEIISFGRTMALNKNKKKPVAKNNWMRIKMSQGKSSPGLLFFDAAIKTGMLTTTMILEQTNAKIAP
jgi:hypothetical protein